MISSKLVPVVALSVTAMWAMSVFAQRAGQSVSIQTGVVTGMQSVDLNDGNAISGALVGGALGAALTRSSKGSGRRDKNAAIGAVVGAAAAASKTKPGTVYTVTATDGSMIRIATEQTEIRMDDCVYVEKSGNSVNIRRAPGAACAQGSRDLLNDPVIAEEMQEDASMCATAKQELIDADSDQAVDRAIRKVQLLCYD